MSRSTTISIRLQMGKLLLLLIMLSAAILIHLSLRLAILELQLGWLRNRCQSVRLWPSYLAVHDFWIDRSTIEARAVDLKTPSSVCKMNVFKIVDHVNTWWMCSDKINTLITSILPIISRRTSKKTTLFSHRSPFLSCFLPRSVPSFFVFPQTALSCRAF